MQGDKRPPKQRMLHNVAVGFASGCWFWLGAADRSGYGKMMIGGHRRVVHRVAYELFRGPIPAGFDLHHSCNMPSCVNPAHLIPLARREHLLAGNTITARRAAQTHCAHGHPFDAANTRHEPCRGYIVRRCRTCVRLKAAAARHRKAPVYGN